MYIHMKSPESLQEEETTPFHALASMCTTEFQEGHAHKDLTSPTSAGWPTDFN
jgi:hypothetical protein